MQSTGCWPNRTGGCAREVDRLRGLLGRQTEAGMVFDEENREMFHIISQNHADRAAQTEVFYFGN